jgi:hypothetical protein
MFGGDGGNINRLVIYKGKEAERPLCLYWGVP